MRLQKVTLVISATLMTLGFARWAHATTFTPGEFVTGSQVEWSEGPTPTNIAGILGAQFGTVYETNGLLQVGVLGSPVYYYIEFDSADALYAYLPAGGQPAALTVTLDDPVSTAAGALGGEVTTLKLNIDFSAAGLLAHPQGVTFGNLVLTGLTGSISPLNGLTVNELLVQEDLALGVPRRILAAWMTHSCLQTMSTWPLTSANLAPSPSRIWRFLKLRRLHFQRLFRFSPPASAH